MNENIVTIIAAGLSGIIAILLFLLQRKNEQLKIVKEKISDKKYEAYNEVLSIFFDLFKSAKNLKNVNEKNLGIKIIDLKKFLLLYANDEILKKFFEWNKSAQMEGNRLAQFEKYLELMILIRKDMGNPDTKITKDELLRSLADSDQTYIELKRLISLKNIDNIEKQSIPISELQ
ncbi:MAG: hypothetical protein Q8T08_09125 [Ignavibacteria bacterium]|nr:hypothetical protein [Ignavibacteria bacterium]